jgi:hypothetical protein
MQIESYCLALRSGQLCATSTYCEAAKTAANTYILPLATCMLLLQPVLEGQGRSAAKVC